MFNDMDLIVKRYYDELENGKIIATKCNKCGHVEFPPKLMCNECGSDDMDIIEISGNAEMTDCVRAGFASNFPDLKAIGEYGIGVVKLEEGVSINAVVYGVTPKNVTELRAKLPIPVKACIVQRDGYKAVAFKLEEN